jgi:phosphoribosylanthranilate isomerase
MSHRSQSIAKLFFLFDIWRMSLITRVKVGNITSLSEARYCAGMGVDFLGFRLGKGGVSPQTYQDIINWISVPHLVLEAHRDVTITLEEITTHFPGHFIEISKHQLAWLDAPHSFILYATASDWLSLSAQVKGKNNLAFVELDTNGQPMPVISTFPVIRRISSRADLDDAVQSSAAAISLDGSTEAKPGLMDYGFVGEALEALSAD